MSFTPPFPPPPGRSPPPPPSHGFHVPVLAIALIGIITTAILLVSYYIFVIKCCLNLHRSDVIHRLFSRRRRDETVTAAAPPPGGLDAAVIRAIPVIKFRKLKSNSNSKSSVRGDSNENKEIECAVCLCEFEDGEKLRVIPNCCHGFHIDCIDIWLQSSDNCPLCRSAISAASMLYNTDIIKNTSTVTTTTATAAAAEAADNFSGDDDDYLVIEIQGNNTLRANSNPNSNSNSEEIEEIVGKKKLGRVRSIGDELIDSMKRKKDEEFEIQPIRRSISMDLSSNTDFCIDIQDYCMNNNNGDDDKMQVNDDEINNCNNIKIRRSMFSFGYGRRNSRCSVQPVHQWSS